MSIEVSAKVTYSSGFDWQTTIEVTRSPGLSIHEDEHKSRKPEPPAPEPRLAMIRVSLDSEVMVQLTESAKQEQKAHPRFVHEALGIFLKNADANGWLKLSLRQVIAGFGGKRILGKNAYIEDDILVYPPAEEVAHGS